MELKTQLSADRLDDSHRTSSMVIPVGMVEADLYAMSAITAPHVGRRIRLCAVMSRTTSLGDLDDLAFAQLLADAADRISLDLYQGAELLVVTKPDRSEVSEADLAVEAALRRLLHTHRPEQGVLGGERGAEGSQQVRWLIDPIDGTRNFVRGLEWWATLLALEVDRRTEVAMISAPAMGRRWWALRGGGAWTTGPLDPTPRSLQVSGVAELADAYLVYGDLRADPWLLALAERCWRARGIGDFLMWCLLAEGVVDVVVGHDSDRTCDLAAPILLVTEAGGMLTDPAGQPWTEGQLAVGSNRLLHLAVLAAIPGTGGRDPPPRRHRGD
jgi:histidinol-phosphatase